MDIAVLTDFDGSTIFDLETIHFKKFQIVISGMVTTIDRIQKSDITYPAAFRDYYDFHSKATAARILFDLLQGEKITKIVSYRADSIAFFYDLVHAGDFISPKDKPQCGAPDLSGAMVSLIETPPEVCEGHKSFIDALVAETAPIEMSSLSKQLNDDINFFNRHHQ